MVGSASTTLTIPEWTGFIGQFDNRVWDKNFGDIDYACNGTVTGITPGFIHREPVAWFSHHRHLPTGNEAYRFCYLFARELPLAAGTRTLRLPDDPRIRVFAVSVAKKGAVITTAQPLYDDFENRGPMELRVQPDRLIGKLRPSGMSTVDRKDAWADLSMGAPSATDYADQASGNGVTISKVNGSEPNPRSGVVDGKFVRLNDGQAAQNEDDVDRCSWFDSVTGRMVMDLRRPTEIVRVNTYSWHKSNRATQQFSLWGSNNPTMPGADFTKGEGSGWDLLGQVNSSSLPQGGKQGSSVMARNGGLLGPYRWLLWVCDDVGEGTFFTELDVQAK